MWRWIKLLTLAGVGLCAGLIVLGSLITHERARPDRTWAAKVHVNEPQSVDDASRASLVRQGFISEKAIGCLARDDTDTLGRLAIDGDTAAFNTLQRRMLVTGQCRILQSGLRVYIADTSLWSGLYAVRPVGETDAYWTDQGMVVRASR